jgi:hypothetical protein
MGEFGPKEVYSKKVDCTTKLFVKIDKKESEESGIE